MNIFNLFGIEGISFWIIYSAYLLSVIFTITIIILENRNPVKTISWLMVMILLPFLGVAFYLYFGRNFRKQKFFNRKEISDIESSRMLNPEKINDLSNNELLQAPDIFSKINIIKLLFNNNKSLLTENNEIEVLQNGHQTFSSIIAELEKAKHHINLEYYIIEEDNIGNWIKEILIKKAKEGVKIRLIYDDVGSWSLSKFYVESLLNAGIEVYSFMPVRSYIFANKINYRNHRKIIVIDGKHGFVGGLNIADRYIKGTDEIEFWRDTHLRLEGDSVKSLQAIFFIDWYFVSQKLVNDEIYFPKHNITKKQLVQIVTSGPDSDWASIMQTYFAAITTAQKYVYISTPYFLPNESIITALKTVSLSGIDVKIIIPEKIDSFLVNWSSRSYIADLLEAGINVYFYRKGFSHSKLLLVDDIISSVGTANMDIRSFDQNFEVNAIIYDKEITGILKNSFIDDIQNSYKVDNYEYSNRPISEKLKESIARLFSPLL